MVRAFRTTLLILATLAGAEIFSGNISSDEIFFNAMMTQDSSARALLLIKAAEADPENAAAPLETLLRRNTDLRTGAEICRAYDKLWKKHPENPDIARYGVMLFSRHRIGIKPMLDNLKLHPEPWKSDGVTDDEKLRRINLNTTRLFLYSFCADNQNGTIFASKLDSGIYSFSLSSFYNIMAYRFSVNGDEAGYKKMTELNKKMTDAWIASKAGEHPILLIESIALAAKDKNFLLVNTLYAELEKRLTDPKLLDLARATAAQHTDDFAVAKHAVSKIKRLPDGAKTHLLFYAALRAKNFKEAMKLAEKVPEKERGNALRDIAITFNDGELFRRVLASGNIPDKLAGDIALAAAVACKDTKLYYAARRLLAKQQMTPELANTIGYTAVIIGVDTREAGELLKFAVGASPFNAAYLDSLAWWYFRQQLYAEAQKYIDRALAAVEPNIPAATLLEHAGDIYRAQGNFYQAEKCYKRALQFAAKDPECDPARVEKKLREFK